MKFIKMLAVVLIGLSFVGAILTGCEDKGAVIAVVNGDKIYQSELDNMLVGLYGKDYDASDEEKNSIYESLINSKLVEQECKKRKIDISDKELDKYLDEVVASNGVESREAFYEQLRTTYGYSESFVDDLIRSSMEENALYEAVIAEKVKVDEEVLKKAYDEDPDKYRMVQVRHILLSLDKYGSEEAAKTAALALVKRLNIGEDFVSLAKANSDDTGTAADGGLLAGYFGADNTAYVAEFVAASVKLRTGDYTKDPVLTQFGYHIIKVDSDKSSYEDVKDYLTESVYGPLRDEAYSSYLDELSKNAKIERKLDFSTIKPAESTENQ